ncbi:MAG: hypothetical protein U0637_08195 [Phycisphaerales bacterium]
MFLIASVVSMGVLAALPREAENVEAEPAAAQGRMYPIQRTGTYVFGRNGRDWVSRPMIGPGPTRPVHSCENPGPAAYGAGEFDHQRIVVRVGQQLITISPWQRIEMPGLHWLERERILWLKAHNYCSGVRTFRNDAYYRPEPERPGHGPWHDPGHERPVRERPADAPAGGGMLGDDVVTMAGSPAPARIEPRAVIRLPDDAPRFRGRMRVMAPRVETYQVCSERPGVATVRGEWSDGSVIRVLPKADMQAPATAQATVHGVTATRSVRPASAEASGAAQKAAEGRPAEKVAAAS